MARAMVWTTGGARQVCADDRTGSAVAREPNARPHRADHVPASIPLTMVVLAPDTACSVRRLLRQTHCDLVVVSAKHLARDLRLKRLLRRLDACVLAASPDRSAHSISRQVPAEALPASPSGETAAHSAAGGLLAVRACSQESHDLRIAPRGPARPPAAPPELRRSTRPAATSPGPHPRGRYNLGLCQQAWGRARPSQDAESRASRVAAGWGSSSERRSSRSSVPSR